MTPKSLGKYLMNTRATCLRSLKPQILRICFIECLIAHVGLTLGKYGSPCLCLITQSRCYTSTEWWLMKFFSVGHITEIQKFFWLKACCCRIVPQDTPRSLTWEVLGARQQVQGWESSSPVGWEESGPCQQQRCHRRPAPSEKRCCSLFPLHLSTWLVKNLSAFDVLGLVYSSKHCFWGQRRGSLG